MDLNSLPNETGIYVIHCRMNDFVYFGSASRIKVRGVNGIKRRLRQHYNHLNSGTHHNQLLQRYWNKYGSDAFECYAVELCPPESLLEREQWWINLRGINVANRSFNLSAIAGRPGAIGEGGIEKIRQSNSKVLWRVLSPDGEEFLVKGLKSFCKDRGLNQSNLIQVARFNQMQSDGWRCYYASTTQEEIDEETCRLKDRASNGKQKTSENNAKRNQRRYLVEKPDGVQYCVENLHSHIEMDLPEFNYSYLHAAMMRHKRYKGWLFMPLHAPFTETRRKPRLSGKRWLVIEPDGSELEVLNLKAYCLSKGLSSNLMSEVGRGVRGRTQHNGYKCKLLE